MRITGHPIDRAAASRAPSDWSSPSYPGITGTPEAAIKRRAACLSPMARWTAGGGPMNVRPARATASAKSALWLRKP